MIASDLANQDKIYNYKYFYPVCLEQGTWLKIPKAARWRRPAAYRKIRKGGEELGKKATRVLMYQIRLEQKHPQADHS